MTTDTDPLADAIVDDEFRVASPKQEQDAPWGYKPDGTPYKRDPSRYAKRAANQQTPARKPTANKSSAPKGTDYANAVMGLLQLPMAAMALGGQVTKSEALVADSCAMVQYGPALANATAELAANDPRIAAVLDKISVIGPYSALLGVVIPLSLQIVVNHSNKQVPEQVTAATGVMSRSDLIAQVTGQGKN